MTNSAANLIGNCRLPVLLGNMTNKPPSLRKGTPVAAVDSISFSEIRFVYRCLYEIEKKPMKSGKQQGSPSSDTDELDKFAPKFRLVCNKRMLISVIPTLSVSK